MSWTHYNHPIFVGSIKSQVPGGSLHFINYIIGDTSGTSTHTRWTWGSGKTIGEFCTDNGLTLHYAETGGTSNTTNTNRPFDTHGPEAVVLNPYTTESSFSGLTGLTNAVTHIYDQTDTDIYKVNSSCRFVLANNSTLNHDPEHEHLILEHTRPSSENSGPYNFYTTFYVSHEARYNYGVAYTSNGRTSYSIGTGLYITGVGMDNWNPRDAAFGTAGNTADTGYGLFVCRGGSIACSKAINGGSFDVINTSFNGNRTAGAIQEWRSFGSSFSSFNGRVSNYSIQYINPNTDLISLELNQGLISENLGEYGEFTLRDFDVSKNPYIVDIGPDSPKNRGHRDYLVLNSETGSDVIAMWRDQRNANSQKGNIVTSKEVSFNVYDTTAQPIEGCKMYSVDNPSDAAKDVTFTAGSVMKNTYHSRFTGTNGAGSGLSSSVTIVSNGFDEVTITAGSTNTKNLNTLISEYNADSGNTLDLTLTEGDGTQIPLKNIKLGAKLKPTLLPRVQFHDDGTISYNYANPIEYEKTTDANGNVATFQVITSTQLKPFTADTESAEASVFYTNYGTGPVKWEESNGATPQFSDWDTDRFGKYYKVDRRSDSNTNLDDFTFYFCSYDHLLSNSSRQLKGVGELTFDWILVNDNLITDTKINTDDYALIDTPQKFYNKAKAYLYDNYKGETELIVTRDGNTIIADGYDVVITAANNAASFAVSGSAGEFTGKVSGMIRNVTIQADNKGNAAVTLSGNGSSTVQNLIDTWNASNSLNTITLKLGDGDQIPDSSTTITIATGTPPVITIKAITFIGNVSTDPAHTTELAAGAEVIGTFGDIVNLPWEVSNIESGSTVQLYNVTKDVELHNDVTDNGTQGEFTGQVSGMSTGVTITANTKGNSAVTLTGTGSTTINGLIDAWNTANPINTIVLTLGSGDQTPALDTTITIPAGDKATAIGSYTDTPENPGDPYAEVGDTIRLRITCQAGVFAFFPYETFGITTTSGITFKADQRLDFFYNDNGIDGSTLDLSAGGTLDADYTIDVTNDDGAIDIDEDGDDGKIDVRGIYAFYVYQTTTTDGIENWFGAITPIDHQNYRVNNGYNIKLENTGSNTILVTGARLFREDGQSVLSSASTAPMMQDNGELVQYIRTQVNESIEQNIPPAVSDAVNANETITTIKKKTNLIPGLL